MTKGLEGIKIIETASNVAGPLAGRMLADHGAEVIHIEHPSRGDPARDSRRIISDMLFGGRNIESDINYAWEFINCNKRDMTLDLSTTEAREILYGMLKTADVFINNYRPRELEKFKLEYQTIKQLNPRIIYANVTGYGMKGPDRNLPGYDFNVFWTRTGIMHVFMTPDMEPFTTPMAMGDRTTAVTLAYGIMTALYAREKTGAGQQVCTSLQQAGIFINAHDIGGALVTGKDRRNTERKNLGNVLLNSYKTRDGRWIRFAINQPDLYWSRFCRALGIENLEKDPRFSSFVPRIENHSSLFKILEKAFHKRTLAEWKPRLDEAGLPWAPIMTLPEVINDPQARENDFFIGYELPNRSRVEIVANPVSLSDTPATLRNPAPEFSQHTEEILLEYGYTWDDISRLKDKAVIA